MAFHYISIRISTRMLWNYSIINKIAIHKQLILFFLLKFQSCAMKQLAVSCKTHILIYIHKYISIHIYTDTLIKYTYI